MRLSSYRLRQVKSCNTYLSENVIFHLIIQALFGLKYIHDKNIIHGNIKPTSLLLTENGEVKLGSFGVATTLEQLLNNPQQMIRTMSYMAPECLVGEKYDSKSDIWSLGVVLYEMTALKLPFPDLMKLLIKLSIIG